MKGLILIGIAISTWAFGSGIVVKQFTVPATMWYPVASFIAAAFMVLWLAWQKKLGALKPPSPKIFCMFLLVGLALALNNGSFMTALQKTSVAVALVTHYLMPIFVTLLFAPIFLKERLSLRDSAIAFIGLLGLGVALWPEIVNSNINIGALLGIISAVFFALQVVLNRQIGEKGIDGVTAAFYQNGVAGVVMMPFAMRYIGRGMVFSATDWWALAYFGFVALGAGLVFFLVGLKYVRHTSHASIMSYGEPIGAIILAAIFLKEPLTTFIVIGGLLVIGSGIALTLTERERRNDLFRTSV